MSTQEKLQELKSMYEKGLISTSIYEEQQRKLLSENLNVSLGHLDQMRVPRFPHQGSKQSSFLDPKENFSILVKLILIVAISLIGFWLFYKLADPESKNSISRFASQTGLGVQVIPWSDRASATAKALVQNNAQSIADAIQEICHPTGKNSSLAASDISKLKDSILVRFTISWVGGLLSGQYSTTVVWEISENGHVSTSITADSAPFASRSENTRQLDEYFRTQVYPVFYSNMAGN